MKRRDDHKFRACCLEYGLLVQLVVLVVFFFISIFYPASRWMLKEQQNVVWRLMLSRLNVGKEKPMRVFFKILLTMLAVLIVLCPVGFKIWWPSDFNWGVGFFASLLTALFTTFASILWCSSVERSRAIRAWLPFAESSLERVFTIEATVNEGLCNIDEKGSFCELVIGNLKKDTPGTIVELAKQHCEQCKQTLSQIRRTVESGESNWFQFINTNCEAGECEEIYRRLERRREELGLAQRSYS